MKIFHGLGLLAVPLLAATANADVTFSNVNIYGTLVSGATWSTSGDSIDFAFPDATVGDPTNPYVNHGTITITYEATTDVGANADSILLSVLGALSGSGLIYWNEVIIDLDNTQTLASTGGIIDSNDDLPLVQNIDFAYTATHFKVKKTFFLSAIDTREFDLANIGLIEQDIHEIPAPGAASMALMAVGGLVSLRRRRTV